jgi:hypothetical protein
MGKEVLPLASFQNEKMDGMMDMAEQINNENFEFYAFKLP